MTIRYLLTLLNSLVLLIWPQPTYTEGFLAQPFNLNPLAGEANDASRLAQNLIFQSLTKYNDQGELVGDLATSWEVQNEGLVYIVHLKKGVRWHDGKVFGANDVLYTAANFPPMQDLIIDRLDEYTLRFTLPNKYSPFLDLLTVKIIPGHIKWENLNQGRAVGTGDYKLLYVKKRRDQTDSVTLGAVTKEPKIKKVVFKFYSDEDSLKTAAKLGEVDGFTARNEWTWPSYKLIETPIKSRYYAIFFNNDNEAVKPSGVRKKLALAVPTKEIIIQVFSGKGDEVNGPLDQTWAAQNSEIKLTAEEEKDLKLPEKLVLTIPASPEHLQTAAIIQKAWQELGVNLEIATKELKEITETILPQRQFQALLFGQEVGRDPDRYSLWHSTQKDSPGLNFSGFSSMRADKALEEGRKTNDQEERKTHYLMFQHAFADQLPAILLYRPRLLFYVNQKLAGVKLDNLFFPSDRLTNIKNWHWDGD